MRRNYLRFLGLILIGYAFLGRGFAYLGIHPIYIGEVALFFGVMLLLVNPGWIRFLQLPHMWLLIAFVLWGAIRTIPYIPHFGIDALRDGASWGYGLFAIIVASALQKSDLQGLIEWYSKWSRPFVYVSGPLFAVTWYAADWIPLLPWGPRGGVPIVDPKGGEVAVHLVGGLCLSLLLSGFVKRGRARVEWPWWLAWIVSFVAVGFVGRAALLAAVVPTGFLFLHFRTTRWLKGIVVAVLCVFFLAVFDVEISLGERGRAISVSQFTANLITLATDSSDTQMEATKRWRLRWWSDIVNYTFNGEYFWTGKGYGINLADEDGYQVVWDGSLRSPHSIHMTFLARGGVPAFFLWILLQLSFALSLFIAYFRARKSNQMLSRLVLSILAIWMAFMINGSFDVFLEGPQGGIWFWVLYGVGLVALNRVESHVDRGRRGELGYALAFNKA